MEDVQKNQDPGKVVIFQSFFYVPLWPFSKYLKLYLEYCESARKVDLELVLMEMTLEEVEWLSQSVSPASAETLLLKQINQSLISIWHNY